MAAVMQDRFELADAADIARSILWGCWRYRWQACILAWVVAVVGWFIVITIPDVYGASARVYVDTQSTLRPLLRGLAVETDVMTDVNMMARALMSRPNLERLARETDLDIAAKDQAGFENVINHLQASIQLNKDGNNIIQIGYQNNDPQKALAVVTAVLNTFIEGSLGENRSDASTAQRFLLEKLKEYEVRLNEAEAKLVEFKRKNVGQMPGEGSDYFARLQEAQNRLQEIDVKLRVARNRRAELQRQIGGEEPVFGLGPADNAATTASTPQDKRIAALEEQLTELRLKYTDTHPDIVAILRTIESLKAEKQASGRTTLPPPTRSYSALDVNPVYQQMKMQLSQADVEIAQLQTEYADQAGQVGALRRRVDTVPAIEAELKRLTRDYDVTKNRYEELLQRVESARISEDADQSKDDITFRIIDPPAVPSLPVGPDRPLLMTGVLLLALIAGLALAFALNIGRPVFYTGADLERRFKVQVLGSIRLVRDEIEESVVRREAMLLAGGVGAIVVAYALLLVFATTPTAVTTAAAGGLLG
jgi:polysaccharide chain length determinant protein (PEP-CTERM system associated)